MLLFVCFLFILLLNGPVPYSGFVFLTKLFM